jgi:hypothetical protein
MNYLISNQQKLKYSVLRGHLGTKKKLPDETGDLLKDVQCSYGIFYDRIYSN